MIESSSASNTVSSSISEESRPSQPAISSESSQIDTSIPFIDEIDIPDSKLSL